MKEPPKRLGRGLAALLGEVGPPVAVNGPGVLNLPVALMGPSPFQPRREMDETALGELADSIGRQGILQPLLVRPAPGVEGAYQIIAGERRWRAAQRAGLHEVPALVREFSDADAMAAGLVENLQREDLNPVEEAMGYDRLIREFKMTQEGLGEAIGKSRGHINNMVRLLKLPEKVLAMVTEGKLSAGHARALLNHEEPLKIARLIVDKGLSVRQAETLVNDAARAVKLEAEKKPVAATRDAADTDDLAARLSDSLGLRVKISFDGKGGVVTLKYADLEQLDAILALLNG